MQSLILVKQTLENKMMPLAHQGLKEVRWVI
ncbi:BH3400 [Halalkalibacterium halodurans C-125]|uniref:BH3400 protein n=1 Tax=Halalkalibacterium halodurans (strain ATCC BAA-125 / DSM 18197 / FERM 7344 / JCM 9153 / C-125) TaxID=272558 RepID=Q9K7G1_HALH5|nr:BH3400 [Halalkalibacterium halodurans C-125]